MGKRRVLRRPPKLPQKMDEIVGFLQDISPENKELHRLFHASLFDVASLESDELEPTESDSIHKYVMDTVRTFAKKYQSKTSTGKKTMRTLREIAKNPAYRGQFVHTHMYTDKICNAILCYSLEKEGYAPLYNLIDGSTFRDLVATRKDTTYWIEIKRVMYGTNLVSTIKEDIIPKINKNTYENNEQYILALLIPQIPTNKEYNISRLEKIASGYYLAEQLVQPENKLKILVKAVSKDYRDKKHSLESVLEKINNISERG